MSAHASDRRSIRLTGYPAWARDNGYMPISYRLIRDAAVNALIPAFQINGVWHYDPQDTEAIATALRLDRIQNVAA